MVTQIVGSIGLKFGLFGEIDGDDRIFAVLHITTSEKFSGVNIFVSIDGDIGHTGDDFVEVNRAAVELFRHKNGGDVVDTHKFGGGSAGDILNTADDPRFAIFVGRNIRTGGVTQGHFVASVHIGFSVVAISSGRNEAEGIGRLVGENAIVVAPNKGRVSSHVIHNVVNASVDELVGVGRDLGLDEIFAFFFDIDAIALSADDTLAFTIPTILFTIEGSSSETIHHNGFDLFRIDVAIVVSIDKVSVGTGHIDRIDGDIDVGFSIETIVFDIGIPIDGELEALRHHLISAFAIALVVAFPTVGLATDDGEIVNSPEISILPGVAARSQAAVGITETEFGAGGFSFLRKGVGEERAIDGRGSDIDTGSVDFDGFPMCAIIDGVVDVAVVVELAVELIETHIINTFCREVNGVELDVGVDGDTRVIGNTEQRSHGKTVGGAALGSIHITGHDTHHVATEHKAVQGREEGSCIGQSGGINAGDVVPFGESLIGAVHESNLRVGVGSGTSCVDHVEGESQRLERKQF